MIIETKMVKHTNWPAFVGFKLGTYSAEFLLHISLIFLCHLISRIMTELQYSNSGGTQNVIKHKPTFLFQWLEQKSRLFHSFRKALNLLTCI